MRAVIQRVSNANVIVDGQVVGSIGRGLCVLIGICAGDTAEDKVWLMKKLLKIRLWPDKAEANSWSRSVVDIDGELLVVSQFTLYGQLKGKKPSFHHAMKPAPAKQLFDDLVEEIKQKYIPERIATGQFGALMQVNLVNEGPVTICIDSKDSG